MTMLNLRNFLMGVLIVATAFIMPGCWPGGGSEDSGEMLIQTYQVPQGFEARDLHDSVRAALGSDSETSVGHATYGPGNTITVIAAAGIQKGISDLLLNMEQNGPGSPAEPPEVSINYWGIVGQPTGASDDPVQFGSTGLEAQQQLRPVLTEITRSQGPMKFYLLEHLRLTSIAQGNNDNMRGKVMNVEQRILQPRSAHPIADIDIVLLSNKGRPHSIQSRVKLEDDKMIVLGQAGYNHQQHDILAGIDASENLMLYYIISSEID
jgi:hypothetical protein